METMVADDVTREIFARYETGEMIVSCAWCSRVELAEDWQLAPRTAVAAVDWLAFTHGVCPACRDRFFSGVSEPS